MGLLLILKRQFRCLEHLSALSGLSRMQTEWLTPECGRMVLSRGIWLKPVNLNNNPKRSVFRDVRLTERLVVSADVRKSRMVAKYSFCRVSFAIF